MAPQPFKGRTMRLRVIRFICGKNMIVSYANRILLFNAFIRRTLDTFHEFCTLVVILYSTSAFMYFADREIMSTQCTLCR